MILRRRTAVVAAVVVAMAGALSACTGDDPGPDPQPTVAPTTDPEPTETVAPGSDLDLTDPEAVVRRWFELASAMELSGDTSEFREFSSDCDPCATVAENVEAIYASGGRVIASQTVVTAIDDGVEAGELRFYQVETSVGPTEFVAAAEDEVQVLERVDIVLNVTLRTPDQGHTWRVHSFQEVAS